MIPKVHKNVFLRVKDKVINRFLTNFTAMTCIKPVLDGLLEKPVIEVDICHNIFYHILLKLKFVAFSHVRSILCSTVCIKRPQNENSASHVYPQKRRKLKTISQKYKRNAKMQSSRPIERYFFSS